MVVYLQLVTFLGEHGKSQDKTCGFPNLLQFQIFVVSVFGDLSKVVLEYEVHC